MRRRTLASALVLAAALAAEDGPGYPQQTFPRAGETLASLSKGLTITPGLKGDQAAVVLAWMHNGWFYIAGGGEGAWDISNPRLPVRKWFNGATAKKHNIGFLCGTTLAYYSGNQIFDLFDGSKPFKRVAGIPEKNTPGGLHDFAQFPLLWRGHQHYDRNTGAIDLCQFIPGQGGRALKEFPALRNAWGGPEDSLCAIGNLLVVNTRQAVATVDIGDPLNPKVLDVLREPQGDYGAGVYGNRVFSGSKCFDISNPSDIRLVGSYRNDGSADKGTDRYHVTFQHGFLHIAGYRKIDTQSLRTVLEVDGAGGEFALPVGNLAITAGGSGGKIVVHQAAPDRRGPEVMTINPVDNAGNQPLTSRIGVCLEEWPDARTITPDSFIVRPVGGSPISGTLSCQWTIVNFSPNAPLRADTTYEVEIPAGRIRDHVGNPIATTFRSRFSTGAIAGGGNTAPTIANIGNQTIDAGRTTGAIAFTVADAQTAATALTVSAASSDTALVPAAGIVLGGGGGNRTITVTPAAGRSGTATITVTVSDGTLSASDSFTVTVRPPTANTPPTISDIANRSIARGGSTGEVPFTVGDAQSAATALNVTAASSNTAVVPAAGIVLGGSGANRTVSVTPAATATGSATITLTVSDGQATASDAFVLTVTANRAPEIASLTPAAFPGLTGASVAFTAVASDPDGDAVQFRFDFGDGTPPTAFASAASASHAFAAPGHYRVEVQARDSAGNLASDARLFTVIAPLPSARPVASAPIIVDATRRRVWTVNPDSDTITAIDADTLAKVREPAVGRDPRGLAQAGDGTLWVACAGDHSLHVIDPVSGARLATIALGHGAAPQAVAISGGNAYVSLAGPGRLARLSTATRTVTGSVAVGPHPRAIAITGDGARVLVTRFISPDSRGEVVEVAAGSMAVTRTHGLALAPGPDSQSDARGVPNYLAALAIDPHGRRAWVGGKKDNIQRGQARDGQPLTFETTVRSYVGQIDLAANAEVGAARLDIDNRSQVAAVVFSPLGDYAFAVLPGNDEVSILDAFDRELVIRVATGAAPQGAAIDATTRRLFTHDFMGRSVTVVGLAGFLDGVQAGPPRLATVAVATERLSATVLRGKRLFSSAGERLSGDGYLSCAACHLDGGHDGRTFDFTDRGEGLRNTIDLRGRRGTGHGRVHWSANFDEIHDFENDIRLAFAGEGLMADTDFTATRDPLGARKAGRSADLDALAAYVASLDRVPDSPQRNPDGSATAAGARGRAVFARLNCQSCHSGADFTDSASGALHDVGTLKGTSGRRLGATLPGIDTPTLRGLWNTAPYLHDGSAATLAAVFDQGGPASAHGVVRALPAGEKADLLAFLGQLDAADAAVPPNSPPPGGVQLAGQDVGPVGAAGATSLASGVFTLRGAGDDIFGREDEFHFAHQALTGDGEIIAQVTSLVDTDEWAKAGVMIRDGLAAGSRHAMVAITPRNGVAFQRRTAVDGASSHTSGSRSVAPRFLRLVRVGTTITAFEGADGAAWTRIGAVTMSLPATVRVGLCVSSHVHDRTTTATFANVRVIPAAGAAN